MKNITVTVDDELYRNARIRAAEKQTTVSALVRAFLQHLVAEDARFERLYHEQTELIVQIREEHAGYSAEDRLPRDQIHDRNALR
jgi:plasmid stability protein